jgi:acetyl-CoA acetyltransferase
VRVGLDALGTVARAIRASELQLGIAGGVEKHEPGALR